MPGAAGFEQEAVPKPFVSHRSGIDAMDFIASQLSAFSLSLG
jgi:hypothetical protein